LGWKALTPIREPRGPEGELCWWVVAVCRRRVVR
jgi:hypothetical protein